MLKVKGLTAEAQPGLCQGERDEPGKRRKVVSELPPV